jgi:hypothetical protein
MTRQGRCRIGARLNRAGPGRAGLGKRKRVRAGAAGSATYVLMTPP